jgi:hypothetical protein
VGVGSSLFEPLTIGFRRALGGELRSLSGALSVFRTPSPGSLLAKRSLLALVGEPRLVLDLREKTTTTCHFSSNARLLVSL